MCWRGAKLRLEAAREVGLGGKANFFRSLTDGFAALQVIKGLIKAVAPDVGRGSVPGQFLDLALKLSRAHTHLVCHFGQIQVRARIPLLQNTVEPVKEHMRPATRSNMKVSGHIRDILRAPCRQRYQ